MKNIRKRLAVLLVLCFVVSLAPLALADDATGGTCGENATWTLEDGVLTISGMGAMQDYTSRDEIPWYPLRDTITSAVVADGITSIGEGAFAICSSLSSVTIPDSVTSIGNNAFQDCTGLTSMTIPDSVTSIGEGAFYGCTGLTSVTIPDSVTSIGESVFYGCTGLTSVTIPDSVTSIGDWAFESCTSLTSVTLPDSITSIGGGAFAICSSLTSVTLPNSVTSIGYAAFSECSNLTSVTIPDSVTSIGDWAFNGCTSLTSVTLSNSVTSIGYAAFSECSNLTSVTIPDSVTSIGDWAFESCTSLTSVTLPDSVTSIGGAAFTDCTGLTSITIPSGVTSIGSDENGAFDGCLNLTEILVSADNAAFTAEDGILFNKDKTVLVCYPAGKAGAYTIPGSVTSLYTDAFAWCSGLTSITIPDSVVTLGGWSFYFCDNLTSVTIPSSVTSIGDYTFDGCTSLTEILVDAGNPAFTAEDGILFNKDKTELVCYPANKGGVSYEIPESITAIGNGAFSRCDSLTSVTIPESVASIGEFAFNECHNLTDAVIPSSVTSLENYVFSDCYSLESITIPASVTSINYGAFYASNALSDVYYGGDEASWNALAIADGNEPLAAATIHYNSAANETGFADVAASDYFYAPVVWAVEQGVTTGTSATTFSPSDACTRGQIITFLWRAAGSPAPVGSGAFSDVDADEYYADAAKWASEQGLDLSDGTFRPADPCTRATVVEYLYRLAGSPAVTAAADFADISTADGYADAVAWAVEQGVTTGTSATTFSPSDTCTRGQIVTFLYRALA